MPQWCRGLSNRGEDGGLFWAAACWGVLNTACFSAHPLTAPSRLHYTSTTVEGAPVLCAASINRSHFLSSTTGGRPLTLGGLRRAQPGTARVYAHYHVTVTLRLNGFPPSFRNWHMVRAGLGVVFSFLTLLLQMLGGSRVFFFFFGKLQSANSVEPSRELRVPEEKLRLQIAFLVLENSTVCLKGGGMSKKLRTQISFCVSKNLKSTYSVNFSVTQYADISDFTSELWKLVMMTDGFHWNEIFSLILERLLKNNQHMKPIPEIKNTAPDEKAALTLDCTFSLVYSLDGSGSGVKTAASVLLKRTPECTWNTWHNCVNVLSLPPSPLSLNCNSMSLLCRNHKIHKYFMQCVQTLHIELGRVASYEMGGKRTSNSTQSFLFLKILTGCNIKSSSAPFYV